MPKEKLQKITEVIFHGVLTREIFTTRKAKEQTTCRVSISEENESYKEVVGGNKNAMSGKDDAQAMRSTRSMKDGKLLLILAENKRRYKECT
ncbi:hypothetical protein JTB14_002365 [Gonioctena quinquepunctata]|nr:hypothetical protein JTB14_002365 [Gonioctena quinquepunctata]